MSVHTDPRVGSELLGYAIEERVGRGGMGVVYRVYDRRLKRKAALKLVAPDLAADGRFRERFLRESELAISLEHPSVVPIYDAGEVDGQLYLAMRYVEGSDLRTLLRREGALAPARAISIAAQVADALDAAHARALVHRDVKPSNVLLDESEHAYLVDFGLSRRLAEPDLPFADARSLGTPAYVAPEQIEGAPVSAQADVYSLGCLLFECLTGEPPFAGDSTLAVVWAHLEQEPPRASERNPGLPEAIDPVLRKAMAKDPDARYGSCRELVNAAGEAVGLGLGVRERKPLLLAGLAVLVAVVGALAAVLLADGETQQARSSLLVGGNALVRIDPKTNRVSAATDLGADPWDVVVSDRSAWAYSLTNRAVTEVDLETNAVRRTTAVSPVPVDHDFWAGPRLAADAAGAWLVGHAGHDPTKPCLGGGVLTRVPSGRGGKREYRLSEKPLGVALGEGGVWVITTCFPGDVVLRIDPRTGAVVQRVRLPRDVAASSIAVGEGAVWVVDDRKALLARIDAASAAVTRVDLGTHGARPIVGLGAVWTSVSNDWTILRIRPRSLRVAELSRSNPARPGTLAVADGSLWWNDMGGGTVLRLDPDTGRILSTIRVTPPGAEGVGLMSTSIAAGAGSIWVTVGTGVSE